ncbi:MAG: hypothetical protein JXM74_03505, partial [Fusobacteriaceae bacterium]|nr:hypothetical protein [Fusobacteriaceae bacterium]
MSFEYSPVVYSRIKKKINKTILDVLMKFMKKLMVNRLIFIGLIDSEGNTLDFMLTKRRNKN